MKYKNLKSEDIVIFKRYCDILKEETFQDGNVLSVNPERKTVSILWLEGYKSRQDDIEFKKIVAKYDENGEYMNFGVYSGKSVLLNE